MSNRTFSVTAALAAGALIGGSALADGTSFDNHLQSNMMVSPAQLYQIDALKTDFQLGYTNVESSLKPEEGDKATAKLTGTNVFAAGIYNVKDIGLRAGLAVDYTTGASEMEMGDFKAKTDDTWMTVMPVVAYKVGPVALGAAYEVNQKSEKPEEGDTAKGAYNTTRLGALFAEGPIEAGLAYSSATSIKAEKEDELDSQVPAEVTLHGRYAIDPTLAVGALIVNRAYKNLDDETSKDQQTFAGTVEYKANALKVEGDLGYSTAFYKDKDENMDASNIGTFGLGAAALYGVSTNANVGGALNYAFGSDKNDDYKVAVNQLGFAVRGNVAF